MKIGATAVALFIALATMGFQCINDNFLISVNIQGITGTYTISQGNGQFNSCITKNSADYLDPSYSTYSGVRIYDIKVSTSGSYAGNINGTATVNGISIISFNGPFSYFNTARSLLSDPNMTRNPAGLNALVTLISSRQPVTLCGVGAVSPGPFPSGQTVTIEVFGQVDAEP